MLIEILLISRLTLDAMENPNSDFNLTTAADALEAIMNRAQSSIDSVGLAAGHVGCAYDDQRGLRREVVEAARAERQGAAA